MFPSILPLRAVIYQSLFLLIAIAIEATVLLRLLKPAPSPRQSIQYAASMNLLCTVVGWLACFLFFLLMSALPVGATTQFETNLIDFVFFDRWSSETATSLIIISFGMFFASFAIKQAGLSGLKWLLQINGKDDKKPEKQQGAEASAEPEVPKDPKPASRSNAIRVLARDDAREIQATMRPQARAVLFANAWSFSAILAILILRFAFQSTLNSLTL